jgi:uroporphyrinogen-III synthase
MFFSRQEYMLQTMSDATAWRVAVTRDDIQDRSVADSLDAAGFIAVSCPVLVEGPAPDVDRLASAAANLDDYDWVICSSVRSVRALTLARGAAWPAAPRTAAVGAVTAAAMREAGAAEPIVADTFNARALWETLRSLDAWPGRRVLVTTVAGGRRDLIDALRIAGALVEEVEAYTMVPRSREAIREEWNLARPDAVILGSASTASHLIDAIGLSALSRLRAVVPIGPTTAAALASMGIDAEPPKQATFAAVVDALRAIRDAGDAPAPAERPSAVTSIKVE